MQSRASSAALLLAGALLGFAPRVGAEELLIDFERGTTEVDAFELYADQGVTFPSHPSILVTPFARSPERALRNLAPGVEFPHAELVADLAPDLEVVSLRIFAGLDALAGTGTITVTAESFGEVDGGFTLLDTMTLELSSAAGGATPVDTELQLGGGSAEIPIRRLVVRRGDGGASLPLVFDDLLLGAGAPRPPPEPSAPPVVRFLHPSDGQRFETLHREQGPTEARAEVRFALAVEAEARVNLVRVTEWRSGSSHTFDVCGGIQPTCASAAPGFGFTVEWDRSYEGPESYVVSAVAFDDGGGESRPAAVDFEVVAFAIPGLDLWMTGSRVVREPLVRSFEIHVVLPGTHELLAVDLEMNDTSIPFQDTRVQLAGPEAISDEIPLDEVYRSETPAGALLYRVYRLRFDLPLWQIGENRILVDLSYEAFGALRIERTAATFRFLPPQANWGIGSEGDGRLGTSFELPGIPMWSDACPFVFCKDADQDRLLDLWENVAVESTRPLLRLHEDEDYLEHEDEHTIRTLTRVTPICRDLLPDGSCPHPELVFRNVVAFSMDYGEPNTGFDAHHGDPQPAQSLWGIDGDRAVLLSVGGKAHVLNPFPHLIDWWVPSFLVSLSRDGAVTFSVEEDKHGLWFSPLACLLSPYGCGAAVVLRPAAVNVGEPEREGDEPRTLQPVGRHLIDVFDLVLERWPHPDFVGVFPGEAVWRVMYWGPSGARFCGGLGYGRVHDLPGPAADLYPICTSHIADHLEASAQQWPRWRDDDPALVTPRRR